MANKKIKDLSLLETVSGTEILPTGGKGDFGVTINQLKDFIRTKQTHQNVTQNIEYNTEFVKLGLGDYFSTKYTFNFIDEDVEASVSDYPLDGNLLKIIGSESGGEQYFTVKTKSKLNIDTTDGLVVYENSPVNNTINRANVRYFSDENGYRDCTVSYSSTNTTTLSNSLSFVSNKNIGDGNSVIFYFYEDSDFKNLKDMGKTLNLSDGVEVCFSTILNPNESPLDYVNVDLEVDVKESGETTVTVTNNSTENSLYFEINLNQDTSQDDYLKALSGTDNTTIDTDGQIVGCKLATKSS